MGKLSHGPLCILLARSWIHCFGPSLRLLIQVLHPEAVSFRRRAARPVHSETFIADDERIYS